MGEGLLCRLYMLIRKLNSTEKPAVLDTKEFSKVRVRTLKAFPEVPDILKVLSDCSSFYTLMLI
jgi:cobalamin biosynthesis Co2+ chelatase CbiK